MLTGLVVYLFLILVFFIFYFAWKRECVFYPYMVGYIGYIGYVILLYNLYNITDIFLFLSILLINCFFIIMVIDDLRKKEVYTSDLILMWVIVILASIIMFWVKKTIMWIIGNLIYVFFLSLIALIVWYKLHKNRFKHVQLPIIKKIKYFISSTLGEWDIIILLYLSLIISFFTQKIWVVNNFIYSFTIVFLASIIALILLLFLRKNKDIPYIPTFFVSTHFLIFFWNFLLTFV